MEIRNNKLVVVLGMHRSGTSAITRGLQVLGVGLGDRFLPTMKEVNAKGFWEDIDLNALDVEMLNALGEDWHHLAQIRHHDVAALRNKEFFLRAVDLLKKKVSGTPVFGFKDPRVTKLLPFWKEVFNYCQFDVSYVLPIRHPLSVVKSLAKRDGFDAEKSYLLWLGHVIGSLVDSAGNKRVLVDYDLLMQSPDHELNRIAITLDLKIVTDEMHRYTTEFLDQGLRHTVYHLNDLSLDNSCPPLAREVYATLLDVASEKIQFDNPELQRKIEHWAIELKRINTSLTLADKLYAQKIAAVQAVAERDGRIADLNRKVEEVSTLGQTLQVKMVDRDAQISIQQEKNVKLEQAISDKQAELMKMSDWAYAMAQELNHLKAPIITKVGNVFSRIKSRIRSRLARSYIGSIVRNIRDTRRYHSNMVSLEALRESLAHSDGRLIITFPIITWNFRWQRPQQIVTRLRDQGFSVIYIAMTLAPLARRFRGPKEAGAYIRFNNLAKNINKVWLHSAGQLNIYTDPVEGDDLYNLALSLEVLIHELKPESIHYLLQFPGWWPIAKELRERLGGKVIFDCMDDHDGFSTNTTQALKTEHELIEHADLVITSSAVLENKCKSINPRTIQVKNGTEFEHFHNPQMNGVLDHLSNRPVIGYYGAISDWFDMTIVAHCARQRPGWNFILIGSTFGADLQAITGLKNVHLLGEIPYKDLPGYFAYFDVCTIPFKIIPLTLATNPVKFYEFLSAGKPVVSVDLPELRAYRADCYLAQNANEFLAQLDKAYNERDDEQKIGRRKKLAQNNSWDARVGSILKSEIFNTNKKIQHNS